ncbi:MAG: sugar kinase [Hoeflea sp.]|uniref:sugar kinase n=1 Tax=Hoeflea sp. TaxID=1940281 RepID=UPI001D78C991|nr:sugar kinase [Hoeflea sp.]MBU4527389.1 sugar kinase [Alphaproteobacteria bacterium]MBU4546828.1 sugar kinase [Alphaproteobacteria bacterium]MBU4551660.1 sugar kinase [Alphaproteobacteria bacterium]MBV1725665.1 sugar kinase [Hoeflea sp.]MBV1759713.1 sugar kinase [Hoeflea sp.]
MKRKFVSIGECMVEMAPGGNGDYRLGFAGDTLNTAWYAKRTFSDDWEIAYLTAVGDDEISRRMTEFIRDAGIRTDFIQKIPDRTVGLYLIQLNHGERSFAYWRSDSAARQLAGDPARLEAAMVSAGVIYFSGITLAILSAHHRTSLLEAISGARRNGAIVAFDPNLRPRLWEDAETMRQMVMSAAGVSDIILPSHEDEALHFGDPAPDATASRYGDAGASLVVVKNGPGEIVSLDHGEIGRHDPVLVDSIVDTTAAGDSFNAGFLAAYLERGDLSLAIRAGAELAARVISRRGALVD